MPLENIIALIGATLILNLSPGPDTFYIVGRTITQGRLLGLVAALGVATGAFIHAMAATLGLSAILASSYSLFSIIKTAGAVYLIYLGTKALLGRESPITDIASVDSKDKSTAAFSQGLLTNILNPKVALFFMAFFPQFLADSNVSKTAQLFILSVAFIATATIFLILLVITCDRLATKLIQSPKAILCINRIFGVVLIALGIRLATDFQSFENK